MDSVKKKQALCFILPVLLLALPACGEYNNAYDPKNADKDNDGDGIPNGRDKNPTVADAAGESQGAGTTATPDSTQTADTTTPTTSTTKSLAFTHVSLTGVKYIASAAVKNSRVYLYYSEDGENGPYRIGIATSAGLVSSMAAADVAPISGGTPLPASAKYRIVARAQADQIFLGQNASTGIAVDTATWTATGGFDDSCLEILNTSLVCSAADSTIQTISDGATRKRCNATTGALIDQANVSRNDDAKHPWVYNQWGVGGCTAAGGYLVPNTADGSLVEYSSAFKISRVFSLANYSYTLASALALGDDIAVLGCGGGKCFLSVGKIQ